MSFRIAIFAFILSCSSTMAGWVVQAIHKETKVEKIRYVLIYHSEPDQGTRSFDQAIENLTQNADLAALQTLVLHQLVGEPRFQTEVFDQLEKIAPETLGAATRSSGNMHNPKMRDLHADFSKAVLTTPTIAAIATSLAEHKMKISRPSFEKLELYSADETRRFNCALWLSIEPIPAPSDHAPPTP